ncbi:MAG: RNA-directed DNA polymerase, partial [Aestuariibacter sp.]|nr:RNA-directed DNA polymerase [Aestuariibacter sp.]
MKRLIESPKTRLKMIQRQINDNILAHAPIHKSAHGFRKGRSCISHAAQHVKKQYVFVFDLAHCFPSIQWPQVYQVFRGFGYQPSVAKYLTAICTHQSYPRHELLTQLDDEQHSLLKHRHLPQGAPGSPALSNAVLFGLDRRIRGLAGSLNLVYSRYADDMVLSGNTHRSWLFLEALVGAICLEQGFTLNYRKSRILRPQQKQKITGIVVNEKPNIDRRYYDRLKAILTNCVRHGLHSQNHGNHPDFRAYLLGSIQHVKSLNEAKGNKL